MAVRARQPRPYAAFIQGKTHASKQFEELFHPNIRIA
jgi:hypothetical protein